MVTPFGLGAECCWSGLLKGDTAGRLLTPRDFLVTDGDVDFFQPLSDLIRRPPGGAPVDYQQVASKLAKAENPNGWDSNIVHSHLHDCLNIIVMAALSEALQDAGLSEQRPASDRIGSVIGSSKASLRAMEMLKSADVMEDRAVVSNAAEMVWTPCFADAPLRCVQQLLHATGPSLCPVAACASGLISVIQGAHLIRSGMCDVCVVGSADASLRPSILASFHRLGVTARGADPATACKPFDQHRDGFIIGEGGAVMVLESREHAERRGAENYGRLHSAGWLTDSTGITQIDASGTVVHELLSRVSDENGDNAPPDMISLHGTGTATNDLAESNGISRTFGNVAPPCFGIKGAVGHLLGAAGSVEFAAMLLAMKHGAVPGTANLNEQDKACPVNLAATARPMTIRSAIKLSLGFGGHVAACRVDVDS